MPSKFASGDSTNKYDTVLSSEVGSKLTELEQRVNHQSMAIKNLEEKEYRDIGDLKCLDINRLDNKDIQLSNNLNEKQYQLDQFYYLRDRILKSKFFLFLNFFGHWYFYTYTGKFFTDNDTNYIAHGMDTAFRSPHRRYLKYKKQHDIIDGPKY